MEACNKQEIHSTRYVKFEERSMADQFLIKITNTYDGIVNQSEDSIISTKGDGSQIHGLGLQNIKKVVETAGRVIKIEYSAESFILMVTFPFLIHKRERFLLF